MKFLEEKKFEKYGCRKITQIFLLYNNYKSKTTLAKLPVLIPVLCVHRGHRVLALKKKIQGQMILVGNHISYRQAGKMCPHLVYSQLAWLHYSGLSVVEFIFSLVQCWFLSIIIMIFSPGCGWFLIYV